LISSDQGQDSERIIERSEKDLGSEAIPLLLSLSLPCQGVLGTLEALLFLLGMWLEMQGDWTDVQDQGS
jgi:hypothetical protein